MTMKTLIHLLGIAVLATVSATTPLHATPSNTFRAIAAGSDSWVAIDKGGRLLSSPASGEWTLQPTGTVFALYDVAFGNGRFVAVGNEGAILTSIDGTHWTLQNADTDDRLRGVAFGN